MNPKTLQRYTAPKHTHIIPNLRLGTCITWLTIHKLYLETSFWGQLKPMSKFKMNKLMGEAVKRQKYCPILWSQHHSNPALCLSLTHTSISCKCLYCESLTYHTVRTPFRLSLNMKIISIKSGGLVWCPIVPCRFSVWDQKKYLKNTGRTREKIWLFQILKGTKPLQIEDIHQNMKASPRR